MTFHLNFIFNFAFIFQANKTKVTWKANLHVHVDINFIKLLILMIKCNANGALKWKNKIIISQHKELLYTVQCILTWVFVASAKLSVLLIFSVKGTCIIQVPFQYLTDTQIIKKVLVRPVPLVST